MPAKNLILERRSGPFGHDCWHLIAQPDGTFDVEHSWSRPQGTPDGTADVGMDVISAGGFFASVKDEELVRALRRAITVVVTGEFSQKIAAPDFTLQRSPEFDPLSTVVEWLSVCRTRDLDRLMTFYDATADLECACTGEYVVAAKLNCGCAGERRACNDKSELRAYWQKRLADPSPSMFTLQDVWPTTDAAVLDYTSHNGQLVRSFFYFSGNGLVTHMKCGPIELAKAS